MRQGVRRILESQDDWEGVGEAINGEQAIRLTMELEPGAIVMDITMSVMSGLEATTEIIKVNPASKVLIFTMHDSGALVGTIKRSGAKGLLTKSKAAHELTPALKTILSGQTHFN